MINMMKLMALFRFKKLSSVELTHAGFAMGPDEHVTGKSDQLRLWRWYHALAIEEVNVDGIESMTWRIAMTADLSEQYFVAYLMSQKIASKTTSQTSSLPQN